MKKVAVVIGTGPSLNDEQLKLIAPFFKLGCNNVYQIVDLDVHLACNWQWWQEYYEDIKPHRCAKWTPRKEIADKFDDVNYIEEVWKDGLSTNPNRIHAHHGSGPQILNMALHYGCTHIALIGFDMHYPNKVDDKNYLGKRHYFGEYPKHLQHWPKTGLKGEFIGLIKELETINPADYGVEIINCTPHSALDHFPKMDLKDFVNKYGDL